MEYTYYNLLHAKYYTLIHYMPPYSRTKKLALRFLSLYPRNSILYHIIVILTAYIFQLVYLLPHIPSMAAADGFTTVDHPVASLSSEDDQGSVCSLGSGVTGTTYDVGEDPEWDLLVSTSATASARPTSAQAPDVSILMEGWVRKQASTGVPGFKPWQPRYFVLLGDSLELRYVMSPWDGSGRLTPGMTRCNIGSRCSPADSGRPRCTTAQVLWQG